MTQEIAGTYNQSNNIRFIYWIGAVMLILFLMLISPHALSQSISFLLLTVTAVVLFNKKHYKLFFSYFFVSIIVSKLLVFEFLSTNGTTYIGGGDDQVFTDMALYFTDHELDLKDPFYTAVPYKLYVFVLTEWIKIVRFFSGEANNKDFHSVLLMLNSFWGAAIAVNVKRLLERAGLMGKVTSYNYVLTLFNPFLLYYSSVLLREIFMVFLIISALFVLLSDLATFLKVLFVLLCFAGAIFVRPVNSIIILLASLIYLLQSIQSTAVRLMIVGSIAGVLLFYVLPNISEVLGRDVSSESLNKYSELAMDQAADNSIGALLIQSKNPVIVAILPLYVLLSPIPPPIISDFTLKSLLLSVGSITWLFTVILFLPFIVSFITNRKKIRQEDINYFRFVAICTVVCVINVLMVGFTTHDPRHSLFIYPLIVPMALTGVNREYIDKYKGYFFFLITASVSLVFFYIVYKLLA